MQDTTKRALTAAALATAAAAALAAGIATAAETITYSYDPLGRLSGSTISGGPNNGRIVGTCFDAAGNRTRHDAATAAPASCPTPTPTPTPA